MGDHSIKALVRIELKCKRLLVLHVADVLVLIQYIVRRRFSLLQGVDGATAGYPKLGDVHQYILFCLSISFYQLFLVVDCWPQNNLHV